MQTQRLAAFEAFHLAPNDFNGDGISDVLLRDNSGTVTFLYGTSTGAWTCWPDAGLEP